MTIALDHVPAARSSRIIRVIRSWLAAFHHYWFVESAGPADPLLSMSARDWSDLPIWHPTSADE